MNETPSDLKFLDSHEWVKVDDNTVIVGCAFIKSFNFFFVMKNEVFNVLIPT